MPRPRLLLPKTDPPGNCKLNSITAKTKAKKQICRRLMLCDIVGFGELATDTVLFYHCTGHMPVR